MKLTFQKLKKKVKLSQVARLRKTSSLRLRYKLKSFFVGLVLFLGFSFSSFSNDENPLHSPCINYLQVMYKVRLTPCGVTDQFGTGYVEGGCNYNVLALMKALTNLGADQEKASLVLIYTMPMGLNIKPMFPYKQPGLPSVFHVVLEYEEKILDLDYFAIPRADSIEHYFENNFGNLLNPTFDNIRIVRVSLKEYQKFTDRFYNEQWRELIKRGEEEKTSQTLYDFLKSKNPNYTPRHPYILKSGRSR